MPAPTPYKDPSGTRPVSSTKALTLNEQIKLKDMLKHKPLALEPVPAPASPRKFGKDELKSGVQRLTQRLVDYLNEGDRFEQLMRESKLKDLAVVLGITTEKMLLLEGQPTQIISHNQQAKIDEVGQRLGELLKQRGLAKSVTLTERTAEVKLS